MASEQANGVIILGNSGVGKSFLANILIGQDYFKHEASITAVTIKTDLFKVKLKDGLFEVFDIPGLIDDNDLAREQNINEIYKAFNICPNSIIIFVLRGGAGARLQQEDIVAFKAIHKAYNFKPQSLLFVMNDLPLKINPDYEGNAITRIKYILNISNPNICFLVRIDKNNSTERNNIQVKLFTALKAMEIQPALHTKSCDIQIDADLLKQELAKAKHEQENFEEKVSDLKDEIKKRQSEIEQYKNTKEKELKEEMEKNSNIIKELTLQSQSKNPGTQHIEKQNLDPQLMQNQYPVPQVMQNQIELTGPGINVKLPYFCSIL